MTQIAQGSETQEIIIIPQVRDGNYISLVKAADLPDKREVFVESIATTEVVPPGEWRDVMFIAVSPPLNHQDVYDFNPLLYLEQSVRRQITIVLGTDQYTLYLVDQNRDTFYPGPKVTTTTFAVRAVLCEAELGV